MSPSWFGKQSRQVAANPLNSDGFLKHSWISKCSWTLKPVMFYISAPETFKIPLLVMLPWLIACVWMYEPLQALEQQVMIDMWRSCLVFINQLKISVLQMSLHMQRLLLFCGSGEKLENGCLRTLPTLLEQLEIPLDQLLIKTITKHSEKLWVCSVIYGVHVYGSAFMNVWQRDRLEGTEGHT